MNPMQRLPDPPWDIAAMRHQSSDAGDRVVADVAGRPLWFESPDAALDASPEAFAGPALLPALHHRASVSIDARLDATWLSGTSRLPAIYAEWWGYPDTYPIVHGGPCEPGAGPASGTAACFTGGLDSFHTLLTSGDRLDHLVFVHGYDMSLDDHVRISAFERSFREVARRTGKRAVLLRTNLRDHPACASVSWDRTHGAALASAGHVLAREIGTLVIPSSYRIAHLIPWGSHPLTDPLWSSSRMSVVHDDATLSREEKMLRIVHEPIVWENLRVCWENLAPTGNCSRCRKCVRAMIAIAAYGRLADFTVFDRTTPLSERVDDIPTIPEHLIAPWGNLLELNLEPDLRKALKRLLARSRPGAHPGPVTRLVRRVRRASRRLRGR
jgi:hypothetical protein